MTRRKRVLEILLGGCLLMAFLLFVEAQYAFVFPYILGKDSTLVRIGCLIVGLCLFGGAITAIIKGDYFTREKEKEPYAAPYHYKKQ